jgi:hypothetical protein
MGKNMVKYIILAILIIALLISVKFLGKNNEIEEAIENVIEKNFNVDVDFNGK